MLSYFLEAHADKLRTIPLRTAPKAGNFEGKTLYDLVEYGRVTCPRVSRLILTRRFPQRIRG